MLHWGAKKPAAVDDYDLDWSQRLATGETIVSSTWTVLGTTPSLVVSFSSYLPTRTKAVLAGGLDKQTYILKNTITTSGFGQPIYEYVSILVRE